MKREIRVLAALLVAAVLTNHLDAAEPGAVKPEPTADANSLPQISTAPDADIPVVTVNGHTITESDVEALFQRKIELQAFFLGSVDALRARDRPGIINSLIDMHVLSELAAEQNITASEVELDQAVQEKLLAALRTQAMSKEQFRQVLLAKKGITLDEYLAGIKRDTVFKKTVLAEKLLTEMLGETAVTDSQIADFYREHVTEYFTSKEDQVQASHILVSTMDPVTRQPISEGEKTTAREKASEIVVEAKKPQADFAELAQKYSDCPSKTNGGDLGMQSRAAWPKEFSEPVFTLEPGQVSGIVETKLGYHIVKVTSRQSAGTVAPLENVRAAIRGYLLSQERRSARKAFISKLRDTAEIVYAPGREPKRKSDVEPSASKRPAGRELAVTVEQ